MINGDPASRSQALRLAEWIRGKTGGDPQQIAAGYQLDGSGIGNYFASFFVAPFAVAAMVDPSAWTDLPRPP